MNLQKIDKPLHFIIFGASGDLAKVKLFPALYELVVQKRFAKVYSIHGFARSEMTQAAFKEMVKQSVLKYFGRQTNQKALQELLNHLTYFEGQYNDPKDFERLAATIKHATPKPATTMAYCAVPPSVFKPIIKNLASVRPILGQDMRLILEKPLGEDEKSATELFHFIGQFFEPKDLFLLDHYLGKTPVQSILPLRFTNTILNVLLQGRYIANIQINALEDVGIGERVGYFESVGILKDMIQSHLLQIMALITMSMPIEQNYKAIRREKMHVLSSLRYGEKGCAIILGQYQGYRKEKGVRSGSLTPTYAALRCFIDLVDWYQVPIYIRTGKKLDHRHTTIVVEFKKPKLHRQNEAMSANKLIIELAPQEKIHIHLLDASGKVISSQRDIISSESLACSGEDCLSPHGRLILEAFQGDQTHFVSFEEVIASWRFVDRVMRRIEKDHLRPSLYPNGSKGPHEQNALTACDGFTWYDADYL